MNKTSFVLIVILQIAIWGCSSFTNKSIDVSKTGASGSVKLDSIILDNENTNFANKSIDVSMTGASGSVKLDSIILDNVNTKVIFEIIDKKSFMFFPPGTNNCYFFMDPITKKEYKLLSGEGIIFNEEVHGPKKITLTFEKLDNGIKIIHLIGGKEALVSGGTTVGFYGINLEK